MPKRQTCSLPLMTSKYQISIYQHMQGRSISQSNSLTIIQKLEIHNEAFAVSCILYTSQKVVTRNPEWSCFSLLSTILRKFGSVNIQYLFVRGTVYVYVHLVKFVGHTKCQVFITLEYFVICRKNNISHTVFRYICNQPETKFHIPLHKQ